MIFPLDALFDVRRALPALPILASRALPLLPLTFSSSVLAISTEWICHLEPLPRLQGPIAGKTLSEIFRRAYTNGAWTFLTNIFLSIGSSGYLYLALDPERPEMRGTRWFRDALEGSYGHGNPSHSHPLQSIHSTSAPNLPLRRSLYLLTSIFGILHLFPFGLLILPHVLSASKPSQRSKRDKGLDREVKEDEVKRDLQRWLNVNRIRIWTDVGAVVCAFLALVV
jgi:hypothetical protein